MSDKKISRRAILGSAASAAVAAQAGASFLGSFARRFPDSKDAQRIARAILDGDGTALAQSAFQVPAHPVFICTVHAKWEEAGLLNRPNQQAVGIAGTDLGSVSNAYPQFGFTKQFGDVIAGNEGNIAIAAIPVTTTSGNHVYDGLRLTMAKSGSLPLYINTKAGSLMRMDFSSVGTADGATAVFGPNGTQQITYSSLDSAVQAITNALDPLQIVPQQSQDLLQGLNSLVTSDTKFRQGLEDLAGRLKSAKDPLLSAQGMANTKPTMTLTATNQTDPTALKANNPLMPQIEAAATLIGLGLTSAVHISIANSDPNGGGNHAQAGGNNVAYGPRSPNEVKSCVAQAMARVFQLYPNAIFSIVSDGGRVANGGDSQNYTTLIAGAPSLINMVFINGDQRDDSAKFGQTPPAVTLSDGSSMVPNQSHVMATVAQAAGIPLDGVPYIKGVLKGA